MLSAARTVLLGVVVALVAGVLTAVAVPLALTPAPARAASVYGAPSWWNGDCDAVNWNARARAAGWTGEGAHRLGGVVMGIPVCGPRNLAGAPNVSWSRKGWGELEWQCVEFAQRFMVQVYGVEPYGANGVDVVSNYRTSQGGGLVRVDNGTVGTAPQPGDVMSFSSPSNVYGHVAVVASTSVDAQGNGSIRLATQNDTPDGWRTLSVSGWKVAAFGSLYPYAWLHDPLGRGGSGSSDGAFVLYQGAIYRMVGGAPVYVSTWAPFGGPQPYTTLTDTQWNALRTTPRDGSFLRDPTNGSLYRVVGGAALYLSSCAPATLAGCAGWVEIDPAAITRAGSGGYWNHLRPTMADSTFVRVADGTDYGLILRAVGGSALPIQDCSVLAGCPGYTDVNQTSVDAYLAAHPSPGDGSVVRTEPSGITRVFAAGVCHYTPAGSDTSSAVIVDDSSLACAPDLRPAGPAPTVVLGRAVRTTLVATGGSSTYTWQATSGLPPGLALSTAGVLTGTPTTVGDYPTTVRLVDRAYPAEWTDSTLTVRVVTPLTSSVSAADLTVGPTTTLDLTAGGPATGGATGGAGPYAYTVTGGTLPTGVTLTAAGRLVGGAPRLGTWTVRIVVTDSSTPQQTTSYLLTLSGVPRGGLTIPTPVAIPS